VAKAIIATAIGERRSLLFRPARWGRFRCR
jgi:hypothetical protein